MKRIPGLDGLRAISIVMVICAHLAGTQYCFKSILWGRVGDLGNFGVRVFFIISGYLITLLLLKESNHTGAISLRQFYLRRTLRIFPAFYFYLGFVSLLATAHAIQVRPGDLLHAFMYMTNYFPDRSWIVGHIWSLSVEEQFYLLWPSILVLFGIKRAAHIAAGGILLAPFVRLGIWIFWPEHRALIGEAFPTIADSIATGCVLASYEERLSAIIGLQAFIRSRWFIVVPAITFALNIYPGGRIRYCFLETLIDAGISLCVYRVTMLSDGAVGRLLNSAPFVFVGTLSYSLYLWQQMFLNRQSSAWFAAFPQNICLSATAALLCYYLIERPFLALKPRRQVRAPATRNALRVAIAEDTH